MAVGTRTRAVAAGCLALVMAGASTADTDLGTATLSGELTLGGRLVWGDDAAAQYRKYRDLDDAVIGELDLRLWNDALTHWLAASAENTGYDDQRYRLEGGRYGAWRLGAHYAELPHVLSVGSRSFHQRIGENSFGLVDPTGTQRVPADTGFRWREGRLDGSAWLGTSLRLHADYRIQDKAGDRAFAMGFGTPGGNFIELPAPIEEQIHEVNAGAEWQAPLWNVALDYRGSLYRNEPSQLTADNPEFAADAINAADFGRSATPPDNQAHSFALSGSARLPIEKRNRITASLVYGLRRQDDAFLPHTRNSALAPDPLPAASLDGEVTTVLGNLVATLQASEGLDLKARWRLYDYDNRTRELRFTDHVRNDTQVITDDRISVANDYRKQNADLEASFRLAKHWKGDIGYGWEYWRRSEDRQVRHTHEHGPAVSLRYEAPQGLLLRAGYRFLARQGSRYDPLSYLDASFDDLTPAETSANQFSLLRRHDQADRRMHRFDLLARCLARDRLEVVLTGNVTQAAYDETVYGLLAMLDWSAGVDVRHALHRDVSIGGHYTFQWQRHRQRSRYRPRAFFGDITPIDDPINDWASRTRFTYHSAGVDLELALVRDRLDAELGYVVQLGQEKTTAEGSPGGLSGAVDYPSVDDRLHAAQGVLKLRINERFTVRAGYRYEDWTNTAFRAERVPASGIDGDDRYLHRPLADYQVHLTFLTTTLHF